MRWQGTGSKANYQPSDPTFAASTTCHLKPLISWSSTSTSYDISTAYLKISRSFHPSPGTTARPKKEGLACRCRGSLPVGWGRAAAASGEHGHGDEGFGAVEA